MTLIFQSDLGLSDDLLNLLNDDSLKSIGVTLPQNEESQISICETVVETVETDHQYCSRPHLKSVSSDSGISSQSGGPVSPQNSESMIDSPVGGMSPQSYTTDDQTSMSPTYQGETANSPLGGGVEDLQLSDFNFDTLDPNALMSDDDFFKSLVSDVSDPSNITLNLGRYYY